MLHRTVYNLEFRQLENNEKQRRNSEETQKKIKKKIERMQGHSLQ